MERHRATSDMPSIELRIVQIALRVGKLSDAKKAGESKAERSVDSSAILCRSIKAKEQIPNKGVTNTSLLGSAHVLAVRPSLLYFKGSVYSSSL